MNPFSGFLKQWSKNRPLNEFVAWWDQLESVVVQVYREKMTIEEAEPIFAEVWLWLRRHYEGWEETLRPYWQQTKAAGEQTQTDPFQLLLNLETPAAILGNWRAMQHLPAAREALNHLLRDQGK
ncbi:hypothetical protein [Candidatus Leptofilum sp.]|uniref:hypothetical protein n=1 Tax=Candidatus Leptofilum sp. TaxID=3241576 RepID=UPI003B59E91E